MALTLSGCGGGSSSNSSSVKQGKFIDAAVEGLYYQAQPSGITGYTSISGDYDANENDTVTFYLGGPNGLKLGAASNRSVITPFESTGRYGRAVNLAVMLQSLDEASGDDVLTIPDALRGDIDQATAKKLAKLKLDDKGSVDIFIKEMGKEPVKTDDALEHMQKAFGSMARGTGANPFALGSNKIIRYIDVNQNVYDGDKTLTFVHADKTLDEKTYNATRGMTMMNYRAENNGVRELEGSNDTSFSGITAEEYLTCVGKNRKFTPGAPNTCDGGPLPPVGDKYKISDGNKFSYLLLNPLGRRTSDSINVDDVSDGLPFSASNAQGLNSYQVTEVYDDNKDGTGYQYDITSGSYDMTTGVYTQIVKKVELNSNDKNDIKRATERTAFYYLVDSINDAKYIDFNGTWESSEICTNGEKAITTLVFNDNGVTASGSECSGGTKAEILQEEEHFYADLAKIDYWWFGQEGRVSKATITELNSTVRFCDADGYKYGNQCPSDDTFFVKWEYQPAGPNWDQGLLSRRKMDSAGKTVGVSIMQKIN